ncbi:alkaline phosphatase, tissue-nonspecific isozyme-like [Heptranchias perlo]|uniref:alkaline phosphatase, tissue-nonspecific isozyme-like n=1 Tax=Heptranchias perlo TaxID=212740 RepID=UPI003559DAA6
MDTFPYTSLTKVYCVDAQVPDSACTASAFLCGVKTKKFTLGTTSAVEYDQCNSTFGNEVTSILNWAKSAGKSVGIVTTTRLMHATPAAAYAHTVNRHWFSDAEMPNVAKEQGCKDISTQLIYNIPNIEVIMGGGRKYMTPKSTKDPEYRNAAHAEGIRLDGINLIDKWIETKIDKPVFNHSVYVWNKAQLDKVNLETTDYLLGLFEPHDMAFELERNTTQDPSLVDMVDKAVRILRKNPNGFFLLVEGGRIDHGHHNGQAKHALYETITLDNSIKRAGFLTDEGDTLTVVTADHSHTLSFGGYNDRGNPILGFVSYHSDIDDKPFTSLAYGNGPGWAIVNGTRDNLTNIDTSYAKYKQQAAVPLKQETHSGEDVVVYAKGPWSHLFRGTNDQTFICHVLAYAACIGPHATHCSESKLSGAPPMNSLNHMAILIYCLLLALTMN